MNARVLVAVGLVAAALVLGNLGGAPFVDPPEGTHAEIARAMRQSGDWITPRLDGVPYFDKPPLLYWLLAASFAVFGPLEWAARLWSALPAIAVAVLTARIGVVLGSARMGLLAGLIAVANLEVFVFSRLVKPDLLFVALIWLAWSAFVDAYVGGRRGAIYVFYACLGLAVLAKDIMGALGPLAALAVLFRVTREPRAWTRWAPAGGVGLLIAIAAPWYALAEWRHHGFIWYTIVDNHLLNVARHRVFPDEDVPLSAAEFLAVTAAGFFPWILVLPLAIAAVLRRVAATAQDRMWLLLALWTLGVLGFFAASPFKLPHYGLPAFPAMALLVARACEEVVEGVRAPARSPRRLLALPLAALGSLAALAILVWQGMIALPAGALSAADVSTRNMAALGQEASAGFLAPLQPLFASLALIFAAGAAGVAVAAWRQRAMVGVGAMLATMMAFLPVSVEGLTVFATSRSVAPLAEEVALRSRGDDVLAHEGPIENSASWLLGLDRAVRIVDGRRSSLAFGSTFPEARGVFWDRRDLGEAWGGERRVFLLSVVRPDHSAVRDLPAGAAHLLREGGGRWLYSNRP
ncbi:MAG TPA: glycosyltransferase family 39 protein [Candidatus Methylomirabilis sp.]|nr:glycosyltransferase family 39 protein [Candidatus Methylomirabilis sp.]